MHSKPSSVFQRDAIHRHCKFHVTRIAKINYLAGPVQIATLAQAAARENKSILEYLSVIRSILMNQLVRNAEKGNARTAGQISGYLTTVLQTLGKITGEISALASTTLTGKFSPTEWATRAVAAYKRHEADRIVAEANQGGAMVETTLRAVDRSIPVRLVHASRGKITRAEPVSALYEQ